MNVFEIISIYHKAFCQGLLVTFELAGITWVTGLAFGSITGAAAHRWPSSIGILLRVMSFVLSGIPFLVLLYWAHFPLQTLLKVVINPFTTASVVLSCVNTVIVAEVLRGSLDDFRDEYVVAAQVCGMTPVETLRYVKLPLVARQSIPTVLAAQVLMLQSTLFASLISVEEVFRVAQRINSAIYKPVEIYTVLALFFLLLCAPLYFLAYWLRQRFTRDVSEK